MKMSRRRMVQATLLAALIGTGSVRAARQHVVVSDGDSLTYGQDTTATTTLSPINGATAGRSPPPYPETLARLLAPGHTVLNHGFPGDRKTQRLERWKATVDADVAILMYETDDSMNYGGHPGIVSVMQYSQNLARLVERRRRDVAAIIVVAPPPIADAVAVRRLEPYRTAAARVARSEGARFHAMSRRRDLWSDRVHLSPTGYAVLAKALAPIVASVLRDSERR